MDDGLIFVAFYNEIMLFLTERKISFDVRFFKGSNDFVGGVRIVPHWDFSNPYHEIYKKQFEDYHLIKG